MESVVLEIPAEIEGRLFTNLAINEDFIFALTISENQPTNSRIIQFERNGKFVQEIGMTINGNNSLFFDEQKKIIGINNGDNIYQYNFEGKLIREIKAIGRDQVVYEGKHYAVNINFPALGEPIDYRLLESNDIGESEKLITEFQDNSKFTVGQHLRFSKHATGLLLWNNIDHNFFKIENSNINVKYQLHISKTLKSRANTMITGNWLVFPARDLKEKQNIIKFINLSSDESFDTVDGYDTGIIDDLTNSGPVHLHASATYGKVENKIFFLKTVSEVQKAKSEYPTGFKLLLIATLK